MIAHLSGTLREKHLQQLIVDVGGVGYQVTVPLALTRFVELNPGDADAAVAQMREAGVRLIE